MDDLLSIAVSNAVAATVLALAALAVGAVYRRPALAHGMWLLVLLKLVTPPLVFLPVAWPAVAESPPEVAADREEPPSVSIPAAEEQTAPAVDSSNSERGWVSAPRESTALDIEDQPSIDALGALTQPRSPGPPVWPQMLRIVWGTGALLWFLLALERLHHFRRLLRFARPAPTALQERTRRLADALGLRRCPRVLLMPGRIAPMLWAIGGPPRLLVPTNLLDVLSDEQLDTLLLHELAHLRRRDHWVRVLEFVVMGLYWWHPVVWYARRELREAEEQCCDAWVVSTLPGTGRTYASALLDTLDFLSTAQAAVPPLASGLGQIADLKRRLTMIMQGNTPRSLTWPGCLAVVALGLTLLPMMPSLHGQTPRKEEASKSIEQAEKALEQAKAALEYQRAVVEAKKAELEHAKQRLRDETHEQVLELKKAEEGQARIMRVVRIAAYRIEITLPADGSVNQKEIVEKIRTVLPEKLRSKVVLRPVPATAYRVEIGQEAPSNVPTVTQPPRPQSVQRSQSQIALGPKDMKVRPPASSEKRINDLEKKLEKVIHELYELRKQIGNPASPPATPVPPGLTVPPAAPPPPAGLTTPPEANNPPAAPPLPQAVPPSSNGPQSPFRLLIKPPANNRRPNSTSEKK